MDVAPSLAFYNRDTSADPVNECSRLTCLVHVPACRALRQKTGTDRRCQPQRRHLTIVISEIPSRILRAYLINHRRRPYLSSKAEDAPVISLQGLGGASTTSQPPQIGLRSRSVSSDSAGLAHPKMGGMSRYSCPQRSPRHAMGMSFASCTSTLILSPSVLLATWELQCEND